MQAAPDGPRAGAQPGEAPPGLSASPCALCWCWARCWVPTIAPTSLFSPLLAARRCSLPGGTVLMERSTGSRSLRVLSTWPWGAGCQQQAPEGSWQRPRAQLSQQRGCRPPFLGCCEPGLAPVARPAASARLLWGKGTVQCPAAALRRGLGPGLTGTGCMRRVCASIGYEEGTGGKGGEEQSWPQRCSCCSLRVHLGMGHGDNVAVPPQRRPLGAWSPTSAYARAVPWLSVPGQPRCS